MTILGSGLAFPLQHDPRGGVALAHDEADVDQAVTIILSTAPGERPMRPEFGCAVHDCVFDRIDSETIGRVDHAVRAALDRWEPRIAVESVTLEQVDDSIVHIHVAYRLKATNGVRNLVHPFYLVPAESAP
jgi:phage baseplate assembly protein W